MILELNIENLIYMLIGFLIGVVEHIIQNWIESKVQHGEEKNQTEINRENVCKLEESVDELTEKVLSIEGKLDSEDKKEKR